MNGYEKILEEELSLFNAIDVKLLEEILSHLKPVFEKAKKVFSEMGTKDILLVGGVAEGFLALPRTTMDVDFVIIPFGALDVRKLAKAFLREGFTVKEFEHTVSRLEMGLPVKFALCMISMDLRIARYTIDYYSFTRGKKVKFFQMELVIPPPEAMIVYKLASEDVKPAKVIVRKHKVDLQVVKEIAEELKRDAGIQTPLELLYLLEEM